MEYATEVLDWLKKQAEVAADRYKRCPAADPSSFTYSAEAKVFGRIVNQLAPLVRPATAEGCDSGPAEDVPQCLVDPVAYGCAVKINAERFIVDASRNLRYFKGARVGAMFKAPNYLTFQDATSASECIKGMLIPEDLERLFPEETHTTSASEQAKVVADEDYWITVEGSYITDASYAFRGLIGIPASFKEGGRRYLSLYHALRSLQYAVDEHWHDLLRNMFVQMQAKTTTPPDRRLALRNDAVQVRAYTAGSKFSTQVYSSKNW
jgi:hypothetical protein